MPSRAWELEQLRRRLLDLLVSWGYELVEPPLVDYLESLLTGTGRDLDLQTFKLTDPVSGRLLGVRADMTPQVARIDAHHLRQDVPSRLCYLGTVLHTHDDGFGSSRSPLQLGAEIFGHPGVESEVEILRVMLRVLEAVGIRNLYLDLGHVGIFRGLAAQAGLRPDQEQELFTAMQRKARREIDDLLADFQLDPAVTAMLQVLPELNGEREVLERASRLFAGAAAPVLGALRHLQLFTAQLDAWLPTASVHYDLAELRGYHYKTGVSFAAFVPELGQEIARGGRYDYIGQIFGRPRPAVGFSTDLNLLARIAPTFTPQDGPWRVLAPWNPEPELLRQVEALRRAGHQVFYGLPGQVQEACFTHTLEPVGADWQLRQR